MTRRAITAFVAIAIVLAGCTSASASPSPVATAKPALTAIVTPVASAKPAVTIAPSATSTAIPTPTPYPTGAPGAVAYVKAYEDKLIAGDYTTAWSMLAPAATNDWGTLSKYSGERAAFMKSAGNAYTAVANPAGTLSLTEWLNGMTFAASVDKAKAVLVRVEWTALAKNNAGWEMWVANPTAGGWELYEVR